MEYPQRYLTEISASGSGNNYLLLKLLLFDQIPTGQLSQENISGIHLFNDRNEDKYDLNLLSEIAEVTKQLNAITLINEYTKVHPFNVAANDYKILNLTLFRKGRFKALIEVGNDELPDLIAKYNLYHVGFHNKLEFVFYLEKETYLDSAEDRSQFAKRLNRTAKGKLLGMSDRDLKKKKKKVSTWYDRRGSINKLKVLLYKDTTKSFKDLQTATITMDLLNLLKCVGHLKPTNFKVLINTLHFIGTEGVLDIDELLRNTYENTDKLVSTLSIHWRYLMKFGKVISTEGITKLANLRDVVKSEYKDQWNLEELLNKYVRKKVQVFVHIQGMAVTCADIGLHQPVGCLKKFMKFKQRKIATFYTAKNIKLNMEISFSDQGLKNECNIYVRFNEGLVGGSANYNPNENPLYPGDYQPEPGSENLQSHQLHGFAENPGFPVGYQIPGYQQSFSQSQSQSHINQQLRHEQPYYPNQVLHYDRRYVQPNAPHFYPPHSFSTGGQANRGNQRRQGTNTYLPARTPLNQFQQQSLLNMQSSTTYRHQTIPSEQHSLLNIPSSTTNRSSTLPVGNFQQNATSRTPSPKHISNTSTSNERTHENLSGKATNPSVDTKSNQQQNMDTIQSRPISMHGAAVSGKPTHFDVTVRSGQPMDASVDVSAKTLYGDTVNKKSTNIKVETDRKGEISTNIIVNYGSAQLINKTSTNPKKSNINANKLLKENVDILEKSEVTENSTKPVPTSDNTSEKDGTYDHVTITKSLKKPANSSGGLEGTSIEPPRRSSSSKVFSAGQGSRDSMDVYTDSFSSASAAFTPEATTSLTGKPVIQASDKESSVTDVMNHDFKSLTTGDFMLTLKCRQFHEIPAEILRDQRCKHTTKINISSNRLKEIPKYLDIEHFPSVKILDASKNKLVDLPGSLEEFSGMENLDISHNQCRIFPEVIPTLKQLKILKVNNNSIEYISNGLGFYKDLEILRLEGNKLARIPDDIRHLESLQYLNISDNRLDDFPLVISQLKKLQFLYMSSNKMKEVPHHLYMNESLEVVQVDKNPIVKPPPDVLARPIQEIRRYCKEIVAGRFKDDRIVILIQGSFNSGKSSVCSALCSDVTQRAVKPTEGIEERAAVIRDINVTIREFSGDLHYRGLIEIFIVHNALYLVTVNLKEYSRNVDSGVWFNNNVWHYLKNVLDRQTVFIIGTHADHILPEAIELLLGSLLKKAETAMQNEDKLLNLVKGSVNKTIDSFDLLKDEVTRCLLDRKLFPERGQYRPVQWKDAEPALITYRKVNQAVNTQQKTALWVPFKTVSDQLGQNGFINQEDMKMFLRYLRSVGSILWHEGLHLLKTFVCANPTMLIKAIKIILSKDHKEAFMKAYKPRWRLNPVPEDDVTYVIACQMYFSRGCINMESIRRILKAVVEDKEDINMIVKALAHFDICKEVNVCTPDIKVMEIQEGHDAGVTLQEEQWPQLATEVLLPNSPYNDDELPPGVLRTIARNLNKDWLELTMKLGFSKTEINIASAQFPGKLEDAVVQLLRTWKQKAIERGSDAKMELMENLDRIGRQDLKTSIMEFDRHAMLANHMRIVLPTWKKLKKEKIYLFPAFLKNGERQMSNYRQAMLKKLMNHKNFDFNLGGDHGQSIDEVFMKLYEIVVERTLSHQIWKNGILTEGIDDDEYGVLYCFQLKYEGAEIQVHVTAASNKAISKYCEEKINTIIEQVTRE